jgi:serine/threonine protein kinase
MKNTLDKNSAYPNDMKYYEKIRIIGKGSYGLIFEAIITKGSHLGEHVAVKSINLDNIEDRKLSYLGVRINYINHKF